MPSPRFLARSTIQTSLLAACRDQNIFEIVSGTCAVDSRPSAETIRGVAELYVRAASNMWTTLSGIAALAVDLPGGFEYASDQCQQAFILALIKQSETAIQQAARAFPGTQCILLDLDNLRRKLRLLSETVSLHVYSDRLTAVAMHGAAIDPERATGVFEVVELKLSTTFWETLASWPDTLPAAPAALAKFIPHRQPPSCVLRTILAATPAEPSLVQAVARRASAHGWTAPTTTRDLLAASKRGPDLHHLLVVATANLDDNALGALVLEALCQRDELALQLLVSRQASSTSHMLITVEFVRQCLEVRLPGTFFDYFTFDRAAAKSSGFWDFVRSLGDQEFCKFSAWFEQAPAWTLDFDELRSVYKRFGFRTPKSVVGAFICASTGYKPPQSNKCCIMGLCGEDPRIAAPLQLPCCKYVQTVCIACALKAAEHSPRCPLCNTEGFSAFLRSLVSFDRALPENPPMLNVRGSGTTADDVWFSHEEARCLSASYTPSECVWTTCRGTTASAICLGGNWNGGRLHVRDGNVILCGLGPEPIKLTPTTDVLVASSSGHCSSSAEASLEQWLDDWQPLAKRCKTSPEC